MRESIVPIFIVIYTKMTRNEKPETCKLVVFHYPNQAFSKFVYMGSTFVFFLTPLHLCYESQSTVEEKCL